MGNSHSQDSDSECESSTYNYHERVLIEAQQLSVGGCESEDQYFSAEEGDESDRSITPVRTRPESSSGEDSSDASASVSDNEERGEEERVNNNDNISQDSVNELSVSDVNNSQQFLSPDNKRLVTMKKNCGQCNVSRFQEHDSIGPELDRSRWDASSNNSSLRTTRQSSRRSQGQGSCNDGNESSYRGTGLSSSPFKPITSPLYSQNVSRNSTTQNFSGTKRKSNQNLNNESECSPKRRHTLKLSPNKRRLGMLDESDSDTDDDRKTIKNKKAHRSSHRASPNTNEQSALNLTEGKNLKRNLRQPDDGDDCSLVGSDSKIKKCSLHTKKLKVVGEKRGLEPKKLEEDEEYSDCSPKLKNLRTNDDMLSDTSRNMAAHLTDCIMPGRGVKKLQGSAFQPLREGLDKNTSHQESGMESRSAVTNKMGSDAIRNSQGKILPVRNSRHTSISLSQSSTVVTEALSDSSPSVWKAQSDSTVIKGNARSLRLRKENIEKSTETMPVSSNAVLNTNQCTYLELVSEMSEHLNEETCILNSNSNNAKSSSNLLSPAIECENDGGDTNNSSVSTDCFPLQNVVLIPPSSTSPSNNSKAQSMKRNADDNNHPEMIRKVCSEDYVKEDEVSMETDESQAEIDSMDTQPYTPRKTIRGKRGLSASERFKQFFTDSSLGSNFKTLFSKRKTRAVNETHPPPSHNQTAWSLYSSPASSLLGQSLSSIQNPAIFQSTSSPIGVVHSLSADRVNFSPILFSAPGTSPLSSQSARKQQSTTSLPSCTPNKKVRQSSSVDHIPTRTSPRFRHSRPTSRTSTTDVSNLSDFSQESLESQSTSVFLLPQTSEFQVLHYRLTQNFEVSLAMGDIAEEQSSGIVNWTDGALTHNATDCSRRICAKAGALMRAACNSYLENKDGALETPDVLTTPAGGRFPRVVKALLHVVSPPMTSTRVAPCLLEINANCLRFASEKLCLDSLSMPLIGEGELPTQLCAEAFIDAVLIFITEKKSPFQASVSSSSSSSLSVIELSSVHLVTANANITDQAVEVIGSRIDDVKTNGLDRVVADIRRRYYGNDNTSSPSITDENRRNETIDRTRSGRPCIKRPRL